VKGEVGVTEVVEATVLIAVIFLLGAALGAIIAVLIIRTRTGPGPR
jgi:hypothetical protein